MARRSRAPRDGRAAEPDNHSPQLAGDGGTPAADPASSASPHSEPDGTPALPPDQATDARIARAQALLDRGDNRAARALLRAIPDSDATPQLRSERDALLARLAPDRVAIVVFAFSMLVFIVVAVLALRHG